MSDLISKKELYRKLGEAYNKGYLSWGANEVIKDIIGECDSVENKGSLISRQAILDRTVNRNSVWNKITDSEGNNLEDIINSIPSTENKGDLISRKAVNKIIDKWLSNPFYELKDHIYEMTKKIHKLPSVEIKGEWNPLKSNEEGMIIGSLPEEGEEVLVTVYGQVEIDSFGCDVEYDESVGECRNEWFCENNDIEDVRAWMPLPEPYKAEN